jgi:hypothetical protein
VSRRLAVHDGKRERDVQLVERLVVGRDPTCDISLEDSTLSRRHAEFVAAGDVVTVRDLKSHNGIFVNGTRADEQSLRPGDVVQAGRLRIRYLNDQSPIVVSGMVYGDGLTPPEESTADTADTSPLLDASAPTDSTQGKPTESSHVVAELNSNARVEERALSMYVFVRLAALAGAVFACTSVALLMWRDDGSASGGGTALAPLIWPILPLFVALLAAYFVANLVNRRFQDVLKAARRNTPQGS